MDGGGADGAADRRSGAAAGTGEKENAVKAESLRAIPAFAEGCPGRELDF